MSSQVAEESSSPRQFLVVGLGNPGPQFEWTPHNLGFLVVDRIAEGAGIAVRQFYASALVGLGSIGPARMILAKPQTFMNLSGGAVRPLLEKNGLTAASLILVYDDLALPFSAVRIRLQGSAGGHNGVDSVIRSLGTNEFTRVRLGIHPGREVRDSAEFVLAPFRRAQTEAVEELLDYAAQAVLSVITEGAEKAMTKFNRRAPGSQEEE